jgi:hypothetical protein
MSLDATFVMQLGEQMGFIKKASGSAKPPAWEVELRAKIEKLRRLEERGFGPRHGRTDSYNYLKALYRFCDWNDPKISQQVSRRVAKLYRVKIRAGNIPIRVVVDATCKERRDVKSRFVQALEYIRAKKVPANRFKTFLTKQGGIEACKRKMAALRREKRHATRKHNQRDDWN